MAKIKVHLLNFHSLCSHIEIVLEKDQQFYRINRWEKPRNEWDSASALDSSKNYIQQASSVFSFDIEADPKKITQEWKTYWDETQETASILGDNCAVAAQWFLNKFAKIPNPDSFNLSLNHLALGIMWPSLIPCPITLPGRIMSNAKLHIEAKKYPELVAKYSYLFLNISLALTILTLGVSVLTLSMAATVLTGGIATAAIIGCVAAGAASTYGFFKAYNISSKKILSNNSMQNTEETAPLLHR